MKTLLLAAALFAQESFEKKLDEFLPRLASETLQEREAALRELCKLVGVMGQEARGPLRRRIEKSKDPAVRAALLSALRSLPVLEMKIEVVGEARVGQPVTFKIRIKNVSDEEVAMLGVLDGSDDGSRFPKYAAQLTDPEVKPVIGFFPSKMCPDCWKLRESDMVVLKPGGEFDPMGKGVRDLRQLKDLRPTVAGKHRLTITADYSERDPLLWNGEKERPVSDAGQLEKILARVPRVKIEAKLEFEVKK